MQVTYNQILLFTLIRRMKELILSLVILLAVIFLGLLINYIFFRVLFTFYQESKKRIFEDIVEYFQNPGKLFFPVFLAMIARPYIKFPFAIAGLMRSMIAIVFIISMAWIAIRGIHFFRDLIFREYKIDTADNLKARRIQTLLKIIERVLVIVIMLIALAFILMSFERIRQVGIAILASAGVIGIIVSFAAQKSFGNILAGIQIAITQPIRLNDAVIVEGEWGWIEEITLTYVVVKIWDLRRLILPITYFIEKPFQNWTRVSSELLGTVYIYLDYRVPIKEVREELYNILKSTNLWNGKAWNLQLTDMKDKTVEMRAIMSAVDSGTAWNLRCYVREGLLEFLQRKYPQSLPRLRVELLTEPKR